MEKCEVFDRVGSCKENVRRNVRCLFELGVVRSLLGEFRGILIELGVVRSLKAVRYLIRVRGKEFVRRKRYSIRVGS